MAMDNNQLIAALLGQQQPTPGAVQFEQSDPIQQIDSELRAVIEGMNSRQSPTPLEVPNAPSKGSIISAGIADAISKLAAGRAPRGLPISDHSGLLRQRRSERDQITRTNTANENAFKSRQADRQDELKIRQLEQKKSKLERDKEIASKREFEAGMAEAAATRSARLQEFLQNDEQKFRAEMRRMEIAARERLANIPDPATKAEVTRVRSALKLKIIEAKRAMSSGSESATFAELEAEFEDELAVNEALSDEDRADLRAFFVANISEPAKKREIEIRQQAGEPSSLFPVGVGVAGADIWQRLKDKFDTPTPREWSTGDGSSDW